MTSFSKVRQTKQITCLRLFETRVFQPEVDEPKLAVNMACPIVHCLLAPLLSLGRHFASTLFILIGASKKIAIFVTKIALLIICYC